MKLSVIICTYNREKYLYNVLKSIADNNFPTAQYEIVLVNNNSKDRTEAICQQFANDFPQVDFHYCVEIKQGLSHARNRGIAEAQGDIIIYVDDDAVVNKEYLLTYWDFFAVHPEAYAAGGPVVPQYETEEPRWMSHYTLNLITGYQNHGNKQKPYTGKAYPGGGNAAYRKVVFDTVGLFNPELGRNGASLAGSEEKDIFDKMRQANMPFYYLPTAILYHQISAEKLTQDYFDRLTYGIGVSERNRTLAISRGKYLKRLIAEGIKWCATLVLLVGYTCAGAPQKGTKLVSFRKNVTKGLLHK